MGLLTPWVGLNANLTLVEEPPIKIKGVLYYKVHCSICAEDHELFNDGCFYSTKGSLLEGGIPCGCSKKPNWTEAQSRVRIKRKAKELGYKFHDWVEDYKNNRTKLVLECRKHGKWNSSTIHDFMAGKVSCPTCAYEIRRSSVKKDDAVMIKSFFDSGMFPEDAKFYRSDRRGKSDGHRKFWKYVCPICSNDKYVKAGVCSGDFTSTTLSLQKGMKPCRCSSKYKWNKEQRSFQFNSRVDEEKLPYTLKEVYVKGRTTRFKYLCHLHGESDIAADSFINAKQGCALCGGHIQQECYINGVYDNNTLVALKFGRAANSKKRIKSQNRKSAFEVRQLKIFTFTTVKDCKQAEKACKEELQCSILSKLEMPDGHTETTSPLNLEKIIDVYKRHGGKE